MELERERFQESINREANKERVNKETRKQSLNRLEMNREKRESEKFQK